MENPKGWEPGMSTRHCWKCGKFLGEATECASWMEPMPEGTEDAEKPYCVETSEWIPAESIVELEDMLCDFMSHTLDSCTDPRRDTKVWRDICNVLFNTIQELKSIDVNNNKEEVQ